MTSSLSPRIVIDKLRQDPRLVLIAAILLRIVTYCFLEPTNNDQHFAVMQYIVDHGRPPATGDMGEGQQPPLYYLLGALVWKLSASQKVVQLLSLVFCVATIMVLYWLIFKTRLLASSAACYYSFLLACFMPQFVMFGLYLSNDSLTILFGCLLFAQTYRFVESPGWGRLLLLAVLSGLSAATKPTMLAFLPVLTVLVASIYYFRTRLWKTSLLAVLTFLLIVSALGSYRYVDNYLRYGDPIANVLDARFQFEFVREQAAGYRGVRSLLDANLLHLLASPSLSPSTQQAYPLLFYATFWYQHIPESSFWGSHSKPLSYLGSVIYLLALFPTFLIAVGVISYLKRAPEIASAILRYEDVDKLFIIRFTAVAVLCFIFLAFLTAVLHYHVWSMPQARLLFPGIVGIFVALSRGVEIIRSSSRAAAALRFDIEILAGSFLVYFLSEYSLIILREWLRALRTLIQAM